MLELSICYRLSFNNVPTLRSSTGVDRGIRIDPAGAIARTSYGKEEGRQARNNNSSMQQLHNR